MLFHDVLEITFPYDHSLVLPFAAFSSLISCPTASGVTDRPNVANLRQTLGKLTMRLHLYLL